ncbi:MAG: DUF6265 family protein [Parvularculaceae bacterium]|nr:DUF6265 family protein [Parvularculaceae bacterium]
MAMTLLAALAAMAAKADIKVRTLEDGATSPPAKIEDLAWLEGRWIGKGLGGCAEESVSPPVAREIIGKFRQLNADGTLRFYEFYTIAEKDGSLLWRIKHFNPDLTGWEDKDKSTEFRLVAIDGQTAYFDGLTYSRTGKNSLSAAVAIEGKGAATFSFLKAKTGDGCK